MGFSNPAGSPVINVQPSAAAVNVQPSAAAVNVQGPATTKNLYGALLYGNGADGAVVLAANTTLTRDMQYSNLTVNAGVVLSTGGWRIQGTGTLLNNGTIANDAVGATPGATGSLLGGSPGAAMATNGTMQTADVQGGNGGDGNGGANTGGKGKASGILYADTLSLTSKTYCGGGSGAGSSTGTGGAGGGVVVIMFATITNNGTIRAQGGVPSTNTAGGGGGGVIVLVFTNRTGNAPAAPGAASGGTGAAGSYGKTSEVVV